MLTADRQIDRRILLEADALEEDGWQVTILAMPLDEPSASEEPSRIRRIGDDIAPRDSRVLQAYRLTRRRLPMNSRLMRVLKALAWRFLVDQERFYLDLFLSAGLRHPAEVVVAHDLPMLAVGRALAESFGARLVYDSHELYCEQEFSGWQRKRWAHIEQRHIGACDRVITVNPSIAAELKARYALNDVAVIHNAERIGPARARSWYLHERFGIDRTQPVLLFQGGLSAGRHLPELVEAMTFVPGQNIHLVILGDGQLAAHLRERIARWGLGRRVHLHPAVAQADLLEVTAAADAGVIPYQPTCLNNYYCTPNKLFEFVAAGLPILASDLPELRRLIEGNGIGRVADLGSPQRMGAAISAFFSDEARLAEWRDRLVTVREQLSWQQEAERLKAIYGAFR